jgi:hypothetical protein
MNRRKKLTISIDENLEEQDELTEQVIANECQKIDETSLFRRNNSLEFVEGPNEEVDLSYHW